MYSFIQISIKAIQTIHIIRWYDHINKNYCFIIYLMHDSKKVLCLDILEHLKTEKDNIFVKYCSSKTKNDIEV